MNSKSIFCFLFLLLGVLQLNGQFQDFEQWTEISVSKKLSKKFSIVLTEELRLNENATKFDDWLTTVGGHYAFSRNIKVRLLYRYTLSKHLKDGVRNKHRLSGDLLLRHKYKRIIGQYRIRYQRSYSQYYSSEDGKVSKQYLRNRFSLKYDIPKTPLMPYVTYEFYYSLNSPVGNSIEVNRFTGGFEYDFTDNVSVKIYYRFQKYEALYTKAKNIYILGASMAFDF